MEIKNKIRLLIREIIGVHVEERIPNPEADEYVNNKENFLGSHTYGENLGDLNKMYVAYSYGEQHPLFVWIDKDEFKKLRPHETNDLEEGDSDGKKFNHFFSSEIEHEKLSENLNEKDSDDNVVDPDNKKGKWFYNKKPYYVKDKKGRLKPNKWTYKHLKNLKPNEKTQARDTTYLQRLIRDFKIKNHLGINTHTNLKPGEK